MRTWWHLLLANLLRWQLEPIYQVQEEVSVGRKHLQIDVVLLRKTSGELPAATRQLLAGLSELLNDWTLLELKGPTDALAPGDYRRFVAYAHLYCAQNEPGLPPEQLTLVVVAPRLTDGYRRELELCRMVPQAVQPGKWRLDGPHLHPLWVLETEVLAGVEHPLLTLFSPVLLRDRVGTFRQLRQAGYEMLMVYMAQ